MKINKKILYPIYFILLNLIPYAPVKDCWYGVNANTLEPTHWCQWKLCQPSLIPCMHTEGSVYILGVKNIFLKTILQFIFILIIPYLLTWLTLFMIKIIKNSKYFRN
ncbi:MAG: hypothetical protein U5L76_05465 [Patescibacteria group bacterium]|nr:hypothetical protein [Patescibacteria group bacterium]